jgi:hypothetical protein
MRVVRERIPPKNKEYLGVNTKKAFTAEQQSAQRTAEWNVRREMDRSGGWAAGLTCRGHADEALRLLECRLAGAP